MSSSGPNIHAHIGAPAALHKYVVHVLWPVPTTSHGLSPRLPTDILRYQPGDHQAVAASEHSGTQPAWGGGTTRLWCLQEAVTFPLLGQVREVGGDPASPPGPATLLQCPRVSSEKSIMPKMAMWGGDSDQGPVTASVSLAFEQALAGVATRCVCPGPSMHPGKADGWYPEMEGPSHCGARHPSVPREQIDASRKASSREARASVLLACVSTDLVLGRGWGKVQMAGSG